MRYITITTWEMTDGASFEVALDKIKKERIPALKGLGANSVTIIRTSDRTSAAITEWPTEAIRDDAELKINEVRNKVHKDDHLRMTGEMRGEIVADL